MQRTALIILLLALLASACSSAGSGRSKVATTRHATVDHVSMPAGLERVGPVDCDDIPGTAIHDVRVEREGLTCLEGYLAAVHRAAPDLGCPPRWPCGGDA